MPLDSDIENADARLHVEFFAFDREPHKGQDFIRITIPGDQTTVISRPVREDDKERFTRQWLYFKHVKNGDQDVPGIPLEEWHKDRPDEVSDIQLSELMIFKFRVVEQIATASDSQLQRIGMGGIALRNHAQNYLKHRHSSEAQTELANTKRELEELKAIVASMQEKRGPGRPPKEAA